MIICVDYCNNVELSVSSAEAESEIGENSVVPVSPWNGEEGTGNKSHEFSFWFLLSNPTHGLSLFFWEPDLDLDNPKTVRS